MGLAKTIAKVLFIGINTICFASRSEPCTSGTEDHYCSGAPYPLLFLLGLTAGIAGLIFRFGTNFFDDKIKEALVQLKVDVVGGIDIYEIASSLSLLLITVGFFVFAVGALGCFGAVCSKRFLLIVYVIIVILLLLAQIAVVALFTIFRVSFGVSLKNSFKGTLETTYSVGGNQDVRNSFDELFKTYKCCGADGPADIPGATLPIGCCVNLTNDTCPRSPADNIRDGCFDKLDGQIAEYTKMFVGVGITLLVFQVLCISFACWLCVAIGRYDDF